MEELKNDEELKRKEDVEEVNEKITEEKKNRRLKIERWKGRRGRNNGKG